MGQGGDQVISKAVTAAIAALFKQTESLEAAVRAEPIAKLLQGSIDGFDLVGTGLRMYNGLRIEVMELYLQAISIDFGAIFKGQVTLRRAVEATMRVVLTEEDLTTSFNTPFVVGKLELIEYQGKPMKFQQTTMAVQANRKLKLESRVLVGDQPEPLQLSIEAGIDVEDRRRIQFVDVTYGGDGESQSVAQAMIAHVNGLMNLDKFALDGTQLRVDKIRIRGSKLVFYGTANIEQFPEARKA
ncbi:MAG: DUF2993 domain-containing protein [Synechococcales cyanobacterium RM1_1_8]|nr:DUF2993 domain-containing protein [Synechococcales cyanobacterium RM1_1_8]